MELRTGFGALLRGRRLRITKQRARRALFELVVADVSVTVAGLPAEGAIAQLTEVLGLIGRAVEADRVELAEIAEDRQGVSVVSSWTRDRSCLIAEEQLASAIDRAAGGEVVRLSIPSVSRGGTRAARLHTMSLLAVPLVAGAATVGALAAIAIDQAAAASDSDVEELHSIGRILASFLGRCHAERERHGTEALSRAVLDSMTEPVAVIDADGTVLRLNEAWGSGQPVPFSVFGAMRVGRNCLHLAARAGEEEAAPRIRAAMEAVLAGRVAEATVEYRASVGGEERWFELRIVRLKRSQGGAVLSILDATSRKRAALETQQKIREMAQVNRVAALGEFVGALAHELNQPLTAMLSNAQAARRHLRSQVPDMGEIRDALDDIIEDDKRAGDFIRRLRAMLTRDVLDAADLDVNDLARDAARLAAPAAPLLHSENRAPLAPDLSSEKTFEAPAWPAAAAADHRAPAP